MVQVKVATIMTLALIAPSLALPVRVYHLNARSEIDAREPIPDPKFHFGRFIRGAVRVVKKVTSHPVFKTAASLVFREDGTAELVVRDLEPLEPRFNIGRIVRTAKRIAHNPRVRSGARTAFDVGKSLFFREDGTVELSSRELADISDHIESLSRRDLEELEELAARDPEAFLESVHHFSREDAGEIEGLLAREYDEDLLD